MAVLIIAEKANQEIYSALSLRGEKITVCTLKEAVSYIKNRSASIILLDPGDSVEKGLRLLREIKALHPAIPIIFISDNGSEDIVLKAFRAGARDFFRKPIDMQELRGTIRGLLRIRRSSREKRFPFVTQRDSDKRKSVRKAEIDQHIDFLRTIGYIEKNLSDEINLGTLAESACMSKYHFCRLFKKRVGISPMKFVTFMRVERAKKLLKKGERSISSIAIEVGFNDLSTFIAHFRKFTGTTPSYYKKSLKKNIPLKFHIE